MGNPSDLQGDVARSVLDNLLEGCQVVSRDYRYLYVNDAVVEQSRATREHLLGRTMWECYPGIDETEMFSILRRCMDQRAAATMENEFTFPDGSKGWFELRFEPVPEGVAILSVDITHRKQAELALRRTMRALATWSRCNQTLVRAIDEESLIDDVCRDVVESGGYDAAWMELVDSPDEERRETVAKAGNPPGNTKVEPTFSFEIQARGRKLGSLMIRPREQDALQSEERQLLQEIALDLGYGIETLRARAVYEKSREQLIAVQRLEAIGRLAGGVAHDFNNILSVILTYGNLAIEQLNDADPIRADIEEAVAAAERAAALTRQLLAFSRKQIMEPEVTNLNDTIRGIESMLRRLIGEDVDVRIQCAMDLGNVLVDPGQVEQVIMNLAVNARDAMPGGGKLTIETRNVDLDDTYAETHISAKSGRYVQISVTDTGTGMTDETCSRVFEPFFTTKEKGKGTGLGLSTVYGIVKQSGGNIWVYSEPGRGTTFKVYLPRVDAPAVQRKRARTSVSPGTETILLVEDESAVQKAAERILQSAGYRVICASTGEEAIAASEAYDGQIDLLLTDVVMPKMSGRDLAERLKARSRKLKVLFTSGYTDDAIVHHGVLDPHTAFIGKPFSAVSLTEKIRSVLDER